MEYPVVLFVFVCCSFGLVAGRSNQPDTHDDSLPIADLAVIIGLAAAAIVVGMAVYEVCITRQIKRRETVDPLKSSREHDYLKQHVNPAYVSYGGNDDDDQNASQAHHQQPTPTTTTTNNTNNDDTGIDCIRVTRWLLICVAVCLISLLFVSLLPLMNTWTAVVLIALLSTCMAALLHRLTRRKRLTYWEEHVNPAYVAYDGNDDDDDQDSALARHQRPTPTTATTNNTNNDDTHVDTGLDTSADGDYEDAGFYWTELLFFCVIVCLIVLQAFYLMVLLNTCLAAWLKGGMLYVLTDGGLVFWLAIQLFGFPVGLVDGCLIRFLSNCLADLLDYWLAGYTARWLAVCLSCAARTHEIGHSPASVV